MKQIFTAFLLFITSAVIAQQPTVEDFKRVFEAHMQKLKTSGYPQRTILFENVVKGTPNGGYYPFKVTAYVHDYGPGYPANNYYGSTCLAKMEGWKFDMLKDEFGDWIVRGRFSATDNLKCVNNKAEGEAAIPLASVPATPYVPKPAASTSTTQVGKPTTNAILYLGEYACYGVGNRLMAGMGFILKPNGRYVDLEDKRGGTYLYDAKQATITFKGGFLTGQVGRNVRNTGFELANKVKCEPWR